MSLSLSMSFSLSLSRQLSLSLSFLQLQLLVVCARWRWTARNCSVTLCHLIFRWPHFSFGTHPAQRPAPLTQVSHVTYVLSVICQHTSTPIQIQIRTKTNTQIRTPPSAHHLHRCPMCSLSFANIELCTTTVTHSELFVTVSLVHRFD